MEYFKLNNIKDENDLKTYENYLKESFSSEQENKIENLTVYQNKGLTAAKNDYSVPKMLQSPVFSNGYLRKNQGKLLKVESLIGNTLDTRIGILLDVGADYIAIKINNSCCSLLIPTASIKYITIIHDNDLSKTAALF